MNPADNQPPPPPADDTRPGPAHAAAGSAPGARAGRRFVLLRWLGGGFAWLVLVAAVLSVPARVLAGHAWALDMLATFAPQLAIALGVLGLAVVLVRRARPGIIVILIALLHGGWSAAGRAPGAAGARAGDALTILTFNSLGVNPRADDVIDTIKAERPSVAVILEASPLLIQKVRASAQMLGMYPHRSLPERNGEWNVIVLSAYPLERLERRDEHWDELRSVYTYRRTHLVRAPAGEFVLAAVLPKSPRSAERWREGNQMLSRDLEVLRRYAAPLNLPIVVAADLNASPTSARSAMALRELGLARAKPLLVPRGTWPASNPPWLRVAIDDILVSPGVRIAGWRTVERDTGSDHAPVVVEVVLPSTLPPAARP